MVTCKKKKGKQKQKQKQKQKLNKTNNVHLVRTLVTLPIIQQPGVLLGQLEVTNGWFSLCIGFHVAHYVAMFGLFGSTKAPGKTKWKVTHLKIEEMNNDSCGAFEKAGCPKCPKCDQLCPTSSCFVCTIFISLLLLPFSFKPTCEHGRRG